RRVAVQAKHPFRPFDKTPLPREANARRAGLVSPGQEKGHGPVGVPKKNMGRILYLVRLAAEAAGPAAGLLRKPCQVEHQVDQVRSVIQEDPSPARLASAAPRRVGGSPGPCVGGGPANDELTQVPASDATGLQPFAYLEPSGVVAALVAGPDPPPGA